jgi:hypothetical protein
MEIIKNYDIMSIISIYFGLAIIIKIIYLFMKKLEYEANFFLTRWLIKIINYFLKIIVGFFSISSILVDFTNIENFGFLLFDKIFKDNFNNYDYDDICIFRSLFTDIIFYILLYFIVCIFSHIHYIIHIIAYILTLGTFKFVVGIEFFSTILIIIGAIIFIYKTISNKRNEIKKIKDSINHKLEIQKSVFDLEILSILLNNGLDINVRDKNGETALHKVVKKDSIKSVKELLERGANVNIKDNLGKKPLDYAKSDEVIFLLKEYKK